MPKTNIESSRPEISEGQAEPQDFFHSVERDLRDFEDHTLGASVPVAAAFFEAVGEACRIPFRQDLDRNPLAEQTSEDPDSQETRLERFKTLAERFSGLLSESSTQSEDLSKLQFRMLAFRVASELAALAPECGVDECALPKITRLASTNPKDVEFFGEIDDNLPHLTSLPEPRDLAAAALILANATYYSAIGRFHFGLTGKTSPLGHVDSEGLTPLDRIVCMAECLKTAAEVHGTADFFLQSMLQLATNLVSQASACAISSHYFPRLQRHTDLLQSRVSAPEYPLKPRNRPFAQEASSIQLIYQSPS